MLILSSARVCFYRMKGRHSNHHLRGHSLGTQLHKAAAQLRKAAQYKEMPPYAAGASILMQCSAKTIVTGGQCTSRLEARTVIYTDNRSNKHDRREGTFTSPFITIQETHACLSVCRDSSSFLSARQRTCVADQQPTSYTVLQDVGRRPL
jgi:hypothetical protein